MRRATGLIISLVLGFGLLTAPTAATASIGQLLRLATQLSRKESSASSFALRAERIVRSPDFRVEVLSQVRNPELRQQFEETLKLMAKPRYRIVVDRELQVMRAIEHDNPSIADATIARTHKLVRELVDSVPVSAFGSKTTLETALREALVKRAAQGTSEAKFSFEMANGRLKFPDLGTFGGVELKGGDVNAYKILSVLAGLAVCGKIDCVDTAIERLLPNETKPETVERLRREAVSQSQLEGSLKEKEFMSKLQRELWGDALFD
jgi:hypothetical protein